MREVPGVLNITEVNGMPIRFTSRADDILIFFIYQTNCQSSAWHFKITKVPKVQMREVPGVFNITEVNGMPIRFTSRAE